MLGSMNRSPLLKRLALVAAMAALAGALIAGAFQGPLGVPQASASQIDTLAEALVSTPRESSRAMASAASSQISAAAAVDYFLKIEGIDGESRDDRHRDEIDILSWSWGETQSGTQARGGGGGAGKVQMQDFHFTMMTNKASPKLMLAVATGQHYPTAVLTARKAGGEQQEFLVITLTDVLISSYQVGGSAGEMPTESISLNFTKIEFSYQEFADDGSPLGSPVRAGYDLKANKAF